MDNILTFLLIAGVAVFLIRHNPIRSKGVFKKEYKLPILPKSRTLIDLQINQWMKEVKKEGYIPSYGESMWGAYLVVEGKVVKKTGQIDLLTGKGYIILNEVP